MMAKERQYERLISFVGISVWGHFPWAMSLPSLEIHVSTKASTSGGRGKYKGMSACIIVSLYKEGLGVNIATVLATLSNLSIYLWCGPQEDLTYLP